MYNQAPTPGRWSDRRQGGFLTRGQWLLYTTLHYTTLPLLEYNNLMSSTLLIILRPGDAAATTVGGTFANQLASAIISHCFDGWEAPDLDTGKRVHSSGGYQEGELALLDNGGCRSSAASMLGQLAYPAKVPLHYLDAPH